MFRAVSWIFGKVGFLLPSGVVWAVLWLAGANQAKADVIYTYSSTFTLNSATLGLATGTGINGTVAFQDDAVIPNGTVTATSGPDGITGFDFDIGFLTVSFGTSPGPVGGFQASSRSIVQRTPPRHLISILATSTKRL
ncbi:MAG: hypothetical protein JO110_05950 [Acetobacteraceae bacterium]|nr:hypothetical protein [Acetobacteraceae bacterium]